MAKKRTMLAGYGKVNQRLDAHATAHMKMGDRDGAAKLFDKSSKKFYKRRRELGLPVPVGFFSLVLG